MSNTVLYARSFRVLLSAPDCAKNENVLFASTDRFVIRATREHGVGVQLKSELDS